MPTSGADRAETEEVWRGLRALGSRFSNYLAPGVPVEIADAWLELDVSDLTAEERIERLIECAADHGAPALDVRAAVERERLRVRRLGVERVVRRRRLAAERRARLEKGGSHHG